MTIYSCFFIPLVLAPLVKVLKSYILLKNLTLTIKNGACAKDTLGNKKRNGVFSGCDDHMTTRTLIPHVRVKVVGTFTISWCHLQSNGSMRLPYTITFSQFVRWAEHRKFTRDSTLHCTTCKGKFLTDDRSAQSTVDCDSSIINNYTGKQNLC